MESDGILNKRRKVDDQLHSLCSPFVKVPEDPKECITAVPQTKRTNRRPRSTTTKKPQGAGNKRKTKVRKDQVAKSIKTHIWAQKPVEISKTADSPSTRKSLSTTGSPQDPSKAAEKATDIARSSPLVVPHEPVPSKISTPVKTRGALMLEMVVNKPSPASPKVSLTPSKHEEQVDVSASLSKDNVRRKLLAEPTKQPTMKDIKRLSSMSARELAQPTPLEPKLTGLKGFTVSSPVKSPRKPAHQRYQSLAKDTHAEVWDLPLSQKYLLIAEKFRCMDVIVNMLQQRGETCTFLKLKLAVEEMLRRSFDVKNVGQIKQVYPAAFHYKQEKNIPGHYDREMFEQYQLTVASNVEETGTAEACTVSSSGFKYLGASSLLQRRQKFRKELVSITKAHHQDFLRKQNLTISDDQIRRWHGDFPLESLPDVPVAALPEPPSTDGVSSARQILSRLRGAPPADGASGKEVVCSSEDDCHMPANAVEESGLLKGVSLGLIEKIKKREAEKVKLEMMRDSETQRTIDILSRLPSFCRILKSHFVSARKVAIPLEEVTQKLHDSHGSAIDKEFLKDHIGTLLATLPQWVKKVKIGKVEYVKLLNKNMDIKTVDRLLENRQKELQN